MTFFYHPTDVACRKYLGKLANLSITVILDTAITADLGLRWIIIASMDIPSLLNATPAPNSRVENGLDIMDKLLQLDGLDARVIRVDKSGVLLATRLGEITGKNTLDLKPGDLIRIRLDASDKIPLLKVSKATPEPILLNTAQHRVLFQALKPNQAYAAVVIGQQSGNSRIQIGSTQYSIARQSGLKKGQLIALVLRNENNSIEIKPLNSEQILKSALVELLPQQSNPESKKALSRLVRILQPGVIQFANENSTHKLAPIVTNSKARQPVEANSKPASLITGNKATKTSFATSDHGLLELAGRLESLLSSIPSISAINSRMIQQWISNAGLIGSDDANTNSMPQNPLAILQQLPDSEATLKRLIQLLFRGKMDSSGISDNTSKDSEATRNEHLTNLTRDILKLIDQSLNHQLLQKINARHQQELQQPITLNLTIPLADQQSIHDLGLKIRQRDSAAQSEKQSWDIHLNFEFGNLGLIASHINLDGDRLSTSFWSTQSDTKQKIDQAIPEFKQQLSNAGFSIGQFQSFAGLSPQDDRHDLTVSAEALLDIKV